LGAQREEHAAKEEGELSHTRLLFSFLQSGTLFGDANSATKPPPLAHRAACRRSSDALEGQEMTLAPSYPIPRNETDRLRTLRSYKILDTKPEERFDELTQLAAIICGAPA
jgi:hypothetical protein